MKTTGPVPGLIVAMLALLGCAGVVVDAPLPVPSPPPAHVNIPKGHYPPPGKCRVWYPDREPGQQPPPGECAELQYRVPPGAVLVRG